MEMPLQTPNFENKSKNYRSQKGTGKKNPRSKRIPCNNNNKLFAEDQIHLRNITQNCSVKKAIQSQIYSRSDIIPLQCIESQKDKTEKKTLLNQNNQAKEGLTINRNKRLKSIGPKSKRNEYIYIVDPQSQKMKKYVVHQGEDINSQLNYKSEYVPPFQSCDEDCESTQEIVQKGVEYSKKDLINEVQRRKRLMTLRFFKQRESQKSSSTDSRSDGK